MVSRTSSEATIEWSGYFIRLWLFDLDLLRWLSLHLGEAWQSQAWERGYVGVGAWHRDGVKMGWEVGLLNE